MAQVSAANVVLAGLLQSLFHWPLKLLRHTSNAGINLNRLQTRCAVMVTGLLKKTEASVK